MFLAGVCIEAWLRAEFAAGRGMTHIHGLAWSHILNTLTAAEVRAIPWPWAASRPHEAVAPTLLVD